MIISVIVSFFSSVIGAICGIGGGVVIKPVMDATTSYSAATISFLSGVTVLCMTAYSIIKSLASGKSQVQIKVATLLGVGAAIGGVAGKLIFEIIKETVGDGSLLTAIQAVLLFLVTLGTFIYTLNKKRIRTRNIQNQLITVIIGIALGMMSSFLGIGGGPIDLLVLYYFFSMETKEAAQNSLYIILLSQAASTAFTIIKGAVPVNLPIILLFVMAASGVVGGIIGRMINKKINSSSVDKLFRILLGVIIIICVYNFVRNVI